MNFVEKILNAFKLPENQNASDFSLQEKAIIPSDNLKKADIIYFKNGQMYKTSPPDTRSWYDAKFLVSDGKKYNLESIHDLWSNFPSRIPLDRSNHSHPFPFLTYFTSVNASKY